MVHDDKVSFPSVFSGLGPAARGQTPFTERIAHLDQFPRERPQALALLDLAPRLFDGRGWHGEAVHPALDELRNRPLRSMARVALGGTVAVWLAALAVARLQRSRSKIANGGDGIEKVLPAGLKGHQIRFWHRSPRIV